MCAPWAIRRRAMRRSTCALHLAGLPLSYFSFICELDLDEAVQKFTEILLDTYEKIISRRTVEPQVSAYPWLTDA